MSLVAAGVETDHRSSPVPVARASGAARDVRAWVILGISLLAGLFLCVHNIGRDGLGLDEFWSIETAVGHNYAEEKLPTNTILTDPPDLTHMAVARPWWQVWTHLGMDNHPPLYFVLLRLWIDVFGTGEVAVRSLSVLFSMAAVVVLYDAVRRSNGRQAALGAAALFAVAGSQVLLSQEARAYTLMALLAAACCNAIIRIERAGVTTPRLACVGLCALGAMLSHYFAIAGLAGIGVYVLLRLRGRARWAVVGSFAMAAVVYGIVWGPFLLEQARAVAGNNEWIRDASPGHFDRTVKRGLTLPARLFAPVRFFAMPKPAYLLAVVFVLPLLTKRWRQDLLLWWLLACGAVAMPVALDLARTTRHLDFERYVVMAVPAMAALFAGLVPRGRAGAAVLVAMVVGAFTASYFNAYPPRPAWRELAHAVDATAAPDAVLVLQKNKIDRACMFYLRMQHYMHGRRPIVLIDKQPPASLLDELARRPEVWLITNTSEPLIDALMPGIRRHDPRSFDAAAVASRVTFDRP